MIHNEQISKKYVALATNKGVIINIDITDLISNNFDLSPVTINKESVNILRNQREEF